MKVLKRGFKNLLKDPSIVFDQKKQTIKLHFDMCHGYGNIDLAIDVMHSKDKEDFKKFIYNSISFNPHIVFISKPNIANRWFSDLFSWLNNCEKIFGFKDLKGYETKRLYAYLAERYLSYWFNKYTKPLLWPVIFFDITKKLNKKIFSSDINIIDDPLKKRGLQSKPFDGEGLETKKTQIVKDGKLKKEGVQVIHKFYEDSIHDFPMFSYLPKPRKYTLELLNIFKSL